MKLLRLRGPLASQFAVVALAFALTSGSSPAADPLATPVGYKAEIKVTPLLKTDKTESGQPVAFPQVTDPEVRAFLVVIPPGAETGWHVHPFPCYAYILSGKLEVEFAGGAKKVLEAGGAFPEAVNTLHNGRNLGTEDVKLVMFVTGEKDKPFTVRATPEEAAHAEAH